jgi:hypothetical protein
MSSPDSRVAGLCARKTGFRQLPCYQVIYPSGMQEEELRRYFLSERSVSELAQDLHGSLVRVDDVGSTVRITDMQGSFSLTRLHLVMLCDAFLEQALTPEALNTVAFALMASDAFEWDDDITSEVLSDWSAPEINFELNNETINMWRRVRGDSCVAEPAAKR